MARSRSERDPTWLEVAVRNGGFRKAITALTWAYSWGAAREALGHEPTVEDVADWWHSSRRSAFREQAAFRQCFPMLESPEQMYATDEQRAAMKKLAATTADNIEAKVASVKARVKPNDNSILRMGMNRATI